MYRIISWFSLLRLYFEGVLNSLKLQWKDDLEIQKDLASLLPLVATSLPAGLAEDACPICRKLGILATDPLCIVCPPVN